MHSENRGASVTEAEGAAAETGSNARAISRRSLCIGLGGAAALLGLGAVKLAPSTPVVRPPGGQDELALLASCIRCERCVEACPQRAIVPSRIENGIVGMRTPEMSFNASYCDWCASGNGGVPRCVEVCPTEALRLPEAATAQSLVIGKASIDSELCLAHRMVVCRNCYDACPYGAMALDDMGRPYVIADACNGCGACESACTSLKNASISVGATHRAIVVRPVE